MSGPHKVWSKHWFLFHLYDLSNQNTVGKPFPFTQKVVEAERHIIHQDTLKDVSAETEGRAQWESKHDLNCSAYM